MGLIKWSDKLSVGNTQIDSEHKNLVNLVNRLHDALKAGKAKEEIGSVLSELVNYTMVHFKNEEALMAKGNYPGLAEHQKQHRELKVQVQELLKKHNAKSVTLGIETANFLRDWLQKHIMQTDKQYMDYV